ncbi:unnamed protein product, partial [marine sediment metagenome]
QKKLTKWWSGIRGEFTLVKTEYDKNMFKLMNYMAFRGATSGLVTAHLRSFEGNPGEIPLYAKHGLKMLILGQIPARDYVGVVCHMRLINEYGRLPQGFSQHLETSKTKILDEHNKISRIFLGTWLFDKNGRIPPPEMFDLERFEGIYSDVARAEDPSVMSVEFMLQIAFREFCGND